MRRTWIIVGIVAAVVIIILTIIIVVLVDVKKSRQSATTAQSATTISSSIDSAVFAEPVKDFVSRITKKPFGIYITPQTSPIQPERFSGYHTGADAEYEDVTNDVPVYATADGEVVLSETADGYGGMFMISFDLNGAKHTALYGHIRPSSLPPVGKTFSKGAELGVLGTGYSTETDGERKHLHFAVLSNDRVDIKGYVQNKSDLVNWLDPLTLYK